MALSQSVLSDLLDAFRAGEGSMAKLYPERDAGAVSELNTGDCHRGSSRGPPRHGALPCLTA
jgi:hypothetical protein